jgi:guanylate kinase
LYGTPRRKVEESAGSGKHVVLDIDVQGARQIREALPEALHVFVLPPSADALVSRLTGRGTEALKDLVRRLKNARAEFQAATEFDVAVVNEHVDETVARIRQLVRGERPLVSDVPDLEDAVRKLRADIDAVLRDELGVDPTAADDG